MTSVNRKNCHIEKVNRLESPKPRESRKNTESTSGVGPPQSSRSGSIFQGRILPAAENSLLRESVNLDGATP